MSETVHYKGKIKLVEKLNGESLEDVCKRIMKSLGFDKLKDWCDNWEEYMYDELYEEYTISNDNVYKVIDKKDCGCDYDMFNIKELPNNEYEYEVMYYDGGMGFSEAIEEAIVRMDRNE